MELTLSGYMTKQELFEAYRDVGVVPKSDFGDNWDAFEDVYSAYYVSRGDALNVIHASDFNMEIDDREIYLDILSATKSKYVGDFTPRVRYVFA